MNPERIKSSTWAITLLMAQVAVEQHFVSSVLFVASEKLHFLTQPRDAFEFCTLHSALRQIQPLERFKKLCGRLERGFLSSGEALATEHVPRPVTEPKRSPNSKRPLSPGLPNWPQNFLNRSSLQHLAFPLGLVFRYDCLWPVKGPAFNINGSYRSKVRRDLRGQRRSH
jgi:hypothetical protein